MEYSFPLIAQDPHVELFTLVPIYTQFTQLYYLHKHMFNNPI